MCSASVRMPTLFARPCADSVHGKTGSAMSPGSRRNVLAQQRSTRRAMPIQRTIRRGRSPKGLSRSTREAAVLAAVREGTVLRRTGSGGNTLGGESAKVSIAGRFGRCACHVGWYWKRGCECVRSREA